MDIKYILKIFIISFLLLSLIVFISSIKLFSNVPTPPKKLMSVVTIEGMDGIPLSGSKSFCNKHNGFDLEKSCNKLTEYNCGLTSCCVYTSDNKCQAGNASGPTFNSHSNGLTKNLDYYYFENKCYGQGCPN